MTGIPQQQPLWRTPHLSRPEKMKPEEICVVWHDATIPRTKPSEERLQVQSEPKNRNQRVCLVIHKPSPLCTSTCHKFSVLHPNQLLLVPTILDVGHLNSSPLFPPRIHSNDHHGLNITFFKRAFRSILALRTHKQYIPLRAQRCSTVYKSARVFQWMSKDMGKTIIIYHQPTLINHKP